MTMTMDNPALHSFCRVESKVEKYGVTMHNQKSMCIPLVAKLKLFHV